MLPEEGQALLLQYSEVLGAAHCLETAAGVMDAARWFGSESPPRIEILG